MKRNSRGEALTLVLIIVGALAATQLVPNWRINRLFEKKAPMADLKRAQDDLAKARAAAEQARADKESAVAAERAKFEAQLRAAQQSSEGAAYVLAKIPAEHATPQSKLGTAMVVRTNLRFAAALGKLPDDVLKDVMDMMDGVIAERDDALAKLAETDRRFQELTGEHASTVRNLAETTQRALDAEKRFGAAQETVTTKTDEVVQYARNLKNERDQNGSLGATLQKFIWGAVIVAGGYVFLAFILPAIVKVMEPGPLKTALRATSGYILNPVLHHDAAKKIEASRKLKTPANT